MPKLIANLSGRSVTVPAGPADGLDGETSIQTVTITGSPGGGSFKLTFGGQETGAIAYNATGADVQTALRALSTIGSSGVTVTGGAGGPYVITFAGSLAKKSVGVITVTSPAFTGGTSPAAAVVQTHLGVNPENDPPDAVAFPNSTPVSVLNVVAPWVAEALAREVGKDMVTVTDNGADA